jgi:hypothetical protein
MFKRGSLYLIGLFLLFNVNLFAANSADTYGFSPYGMSMGNAMSAIVNDSSSVWYNIAGLGRSSHLKRGREKKVVKSDTNTMSLKKRLSKRLEGGGFSSQGAGERIANELSFSMLYSLPTLSVTGASGSPLTLGEGSNEQKVTAADNLSAGMMMVGIAFDLNTIYEMPEIISSARFGFGLASGLDGSIMKINDIDYRTHNFLLYGREIQTSLILAGFGLGFMKDMFGFGLGARISFVGKGSVLITDVLISPDSQEPEEQALMDMKVSPALLLGGYLDAGKIDPVVTGLSIGLAYRMESSLKIDPFYTQAELVVMGISMPMEVALFDYYDPHTIIGGIAYTRWNVTVDFDIEYQLWSKYKVASTDSDVDLPDMNDIAIFRLGVNYDTPFKFWSAQAGYYFRPSIVSDNDGVINFLDNDKHVLSLGSVFIIPKMGGMTGPVKASVTYQLQYLAQKNVEKSSETVYNPSYAYGGLVHTFALGFSMNM